MNSEYGKITGAILFYGLNQCHDNVPLSDHFVYFSCAINQLPHVPLAKARYETLN